MSITLAQNWSAPSLEDFVATHLTADAFGYNELDTMAGLAARRWRISGLVTADEWQSLIALFSGWRELRMLDPDSSVSNSIGTTVLLSGTAYTTSAEGPYSGAVQTWTNVPCWFTAAPESTQLGAYIQVSVEVVDAAQMLAALQHQAVKASDRFYFGIWEIPDSAEVLNLLKPPDTYQDNPGLALTAGGVHFITGATTATRVMALEGDTTAQGWTDLRTWYEGIVQTIPAATSWYPSSPPVSTAEALIIEGVRTDRYTVTMTLVQVR